MLKKKAMFPVTGYQLSVYQNSKCFIRIFYLSQVGSLNKISYHLVRMFPGIVKLNSVRAIPEKNTWGGKTAGDIFFYGWSVRTFFKLYGSLVFDKF